MSKEIDIAIICLDQNIGDDDSNSDLFQYGLDLGKRGYDSVYEYDTFLVCTKGGEDLTDEELEEICEEWYDEEGTTFEINERTFILDYTL